MKKREKNPPAGLFFITFLILVAAITSCGDTSPQQAQRKLNIRLPETARVYNKQVDTNFKSTIPRIKQVGTNFKSAQPDKDQLFQTLKKDQIEVVVRLNADSDKLSIEQEAEICNDRNVRFYYFNIETDPQAAYRQIRNFLRDGNALVHCRHGYDRAGVIMGLWMKESGATDQEVIAFNQWENYLQNKGKPYRKYWDAVFKQE